MFLFGISKFLLMWLDYKSKNPEKQDYVETLLPFVTQLQKLKSLSTLSLFI